MDLCNCTIKFVQLRCRYCVDSGVLIISALNATLNVRRIGTVYMHFAVVRSETSFKMWWTLKCSNSSVIPFGLPKCRHPIVLRANYIDSMPKPINPKRSSKGHTILAEVEWIYSHYTCIHIPYAGKWWGYFTPRSVLAKSHPVISGKRQLFFCDFVNE